MSWCAQNWVGHSPCPRVGLKSRRPFLCGKGGLGLRSARRTQPAAQWASWADAIKMVQERHPGVARTTLAALEENSESESIQAIMVCARTLEGCRFESPSWAELAEGRAPGGAEEEEDPCQPRLGWQQQASSALERHHHDHAVWPRLRDMNGP